MLPSSALFTVETLSLHTLTAFAGGEGWISFSIYVIFLKGLIILLQCIGGADSQPS